MLQFECPSCKAKLQAAPEHAGLSIVCPHCNAGATIPRGDAITSEPIVATLAPSTAVTTPENTRTPQSLRDDEPRRRPERPPVAAKGMSVGMIILLVVGLGGCGGVLVIAILVALLVPAMEKVREAEARSKAMNNLKQIGIAMHNHHDNFKHFPAQKIPAPNVMIGERPVRFVELGWRVSLLPFLDEGPLFAAFDMKADWNDPRNHPFVNSRPTTYDSPWRPTVDPTHTHFQVFTGLKTPYREPWSAPRIAQFTDGLSNTFLIAEGQTSAPWSQPADMVIDDKNALPLPPDRFLALLADGSVRFIHRGTVNDGVLRLLIDPQDGNVIPRGAID